MTNDITTHETILPPADRDAVEIGQVYRRGMEHFIEVGNMLIAWKERHTGGWIAWLEANKDALGFEKQTAQRLMRTAREASLATLEDAHATTRKLWGHEARNRKTLAAARLAREHPPDDMPELPERCRLIHASVAAAANSPGAVISSSEYIRRGKERHRRRGSRGIGAGGTKLSPYPPVGTRGG
jgi:hypothetical protein